MRFVIKAGVLEIGDVGEDESPGVVFRTDAGFQFAVPMSRETVCLLAPLLFKNVTITIEDEDESGGLKVRR